MVEAAIDDLGIVGGTLGGEILIEPSDIDVHVRGTPQAQSLALQRHFSRDLERDREISSVLTYHDGGPQPGCRQSHHALIFAKRQLQGGGRQIPCRGGEVRREGACVICRVCPCSGIALVREKFYNDFGQSGVV